jgi:hypothetical protein
MNAKHMLRHEWVADINPGLPSLSSTPVLSQANPNLSRTAHPKPASLLGRHCCDRKRQAMASMLIGRSNTVVTATMNMCDM